MTRPSDPEARAPQSATKRRRQGAPFTPPLTISGGALLVDGRDDALRETLYLMVLSLGRLQTCREAFGRAMGLTGSQFAVLMGVAHRQGAAGVSIGAIAMHIQLAATHVTTEVGRLIRLGLLVKVKSPEDRRSVLVSLSRQGEEAIEAVAPFVRAVNDRLFAEITPEELGHIHAFFRRFAENSEFALAEIRRQDQTTSARSPAQPGKTAQSAPG